MSGEPRAWLRGDLQISAEVLAEIEAEALRRYPDESCGFVFGPAEAPLRLDEARAEPNLANRYHALDPETFPRTARTYFKMDELHAARIFDAAEAEGRPVKVIYHSHCDAGSHGDAGDYFSAEDAATFARDGLLMWPCAFLVVSVTQGAVDGRRLWVHVPGSERFVEAPLTVLTR